MTLSITASAQFDVSPVMRLVATSTTGGPSPIPDNTQIRVWRNHQDGSLHRVLTGADPRLIGGVWTWLDAHAPFNQPVTYTITAVTSPSVFSAESAPAWLLSRQTWLLHPTRANLAVCVPMVTELSSRTIGSRAAKFNPIGGRAIYLSDGVRDGVTGSITLFTTDTDPLVELLADDSPILINTPGSSGWDVTWLWVQPGAIQYANPMFGVKHLERLVTIPFEECADPDLEFEPSWTYDDVPDTYATYTALAAAYDTYADLVTDTRL